MPQTVTSTIRYISNSEIDISETFNLVIQSRNLNPASKITSNFHAYSNNTAVNFSAQVLQNSHLGFFNSEPPIISSNIMPWLQIPNNDAPVINMSKSENDNYTNRMAFIPKLLEDEDMPTNVSVTSLILNDDIPRKRRGRPLSDKDECTKREHRKEKNRLFAQQSRDKKKKYIQDCENRIQELEKQLQFYQGSEQHGHKIKLTLPSF